MMALIRRSNEKTIPALRARSQFCSGPADRLARKTSCNRIGGALGRGPHPCGKRHRLVGAVEEFDGHEDHVLVADIFQIVHLELAGGIALVARLAGA